jgi:hypothetical protein
LPHIDWYLVADDTREGQVYKFPFNTQKKDYAQWDDGIGEGRVYIVDPLGNLMMSYPSDAGPGDLYDDLRRLLRVSRIG